MNNNNIDDGTDNITSEADLLFIQWLRDNGAEFDKLEWPSRNTIGGSRGAVALENINTNEYLLKIPEKLMITPITCKKHEIIGHIITEKYYELSSDMIIVIFLMYEMYHNIQVNKNNIINQNSFYFPYFNILPEPQNIVNWNNNNLELFQNKELIRECNRRKRILHLFYKRVFTDMLFIEYSNIFQSEYYTFERFERTWNIMQSRAFGKRLPWTAMVPFADCLNHANVQTKYDFNIDENHTFRLFPSGNNSYLKGKEAFNSYGKRSNSNLLVDYGFAILYNEHDKALITLNLGAQNMPLYDEKRKILLRNGISSTYKSIYIKKNKFNNQLLIFSRIVSLNEEQVNERIELENEVCDFEYINNIELEKNAITIAKNIINIELNKFPTTLDEDQLLLGNNGWQKNDNDNDNDNDNENKETEKENEENNNIILSYEMICALTYRITIKSIYKYYIDILTFIENILNQENINEYINDNNLQYDEILNEYINSLKIYLENINARKK